jgi:hypothetical protein
MTVHDIRVSRAVRTGVVPVGRPRHPLEEMNVGRFARRLVVYNPSALEVASLLQRARRDVAQLTGNDVFYRVISRNPDSFWAIARRSQHTAEAPAAEGFLAFLMLNEVGAQRLAEGSLDARNPDISVLTAQSEKPAAIYLWAGHARGSLAAAIPLILEKVSTPLYRDVDIYSRAVTTDGHRALEAVGFRPGATFQEMLAPHLFMYRRAQSVDRPQERARA